MWIVRVMDCEMGFFYIDQYRVEPASNPFAPNKV